jgi:hypothetical protein
VLDYRKLPAQGSHKKPFQLNPLRCAGNSPALAKVSLDLGKSCLQTFYPGSEQMRLQVVWVGTQIRFKMPAGLGQEIESHCPLGFPEMVMILIDPKVHGTRADKE